jgi:hypothetical protein
MATTATPTAPVETTTPSAAGGLATAPTQRLAIAYTPEVIDPLAASIPAGAYAVCWVGQEQTLVLNPGLNFDIDPDLWQKAQERQATKDLLASRAIEVIDLGLGPTVGDTPAHGVTAVKQTDETTALRLVHVSRDVKQLEGWLVMEERVAVRNSIARKIQSLKDGQG